LQSTVVGSGYFVGLHCLIAFLVWRATFKFAYFQFSLFVSRCTRGFYVTPFLCHYRVDFSFGIRSNIIIKDIKIAKCWALHFQTPDGLR